MKTVRELLREKGNAIWTMRPDATVLETLELTAEKKIGAVLAADLRVGRRRAAGTAGATD